MCTREQVSLINFVGRIGYSHVEESSETHIYHPSQKTWRIKCLQVKPEMLNYKMKAYVVLYKVNKILSAKWDLIKLKGFLRGKEKYQVICNL